MDFIQLDPERDYFQQLLIDKVLAHLKSETDENLKLRITLLLAINLLQVEDCMTAADFCDTMLTTFEPLAKHFEPDNEHAFCGGYKVVRVKDDNGHFKVIMNREFLDYVVGRWLDRSGDAEPGVRNGD
jgi:hypothetical protein